MSSYSFNKAISANINVPGMLDFNRSFADQAKELIEAAGSGILKASEIALSGKPEVAICQLAILEMAKGGELPTITLRSFGQTSERVGSLSLNEWRHQVVRAKREEEGEGSPVWYVLNGSGITLEPFQIEELRKYLPDRASKLEIKVIEVSPGHIDPKDPTKGMVEAILATGLSQKDLRDAYYLPPAFELVAACQATALYGLTHNWLKMPVRIKHQGEEQFHIVDVIDVQDMRNAGNEIAIKWTADQTSYVITQVVENLKDNTTPFGIEEKDGKIIITTPNGKFTLQISMAFMD